ncbi:hypothetical protein V2O64_13285 [Verrucomicrobiaceae bacterium 227]
MKVSRSLLYPCLVLAGGAVGWQVKRTSGDVFDSPKSLAREDFKADPRQDSFQPSNLSSTDTAGELLSLPGGELYDRLALFLLDAEAADFPGVFKDYQERDDQSEELTALILFAWCRVDPEGAVRTIRGTKDEEILFRALAGNDPESALSRGLGDATSLEATVNGIGEFHPEWLAENWHRIPKEARSSAFSGLTKWPNTQNPEVSLSLLLRENSHIPPNAQTLLALVRDDLKGAFALLQNLEDGVPNYYVGSNLDFLIETLREYEPSRLDELTSLATTPKDKSAVTVAQFQGLLKDNPLAARSLVDSFPSSWLKEDLAMAFSRNLLETDPEAAIAYAGDFFNRETISWERGVSIATDDKSTTFQPRPSEASQLFTELFNQDAPKFLDVLASKVETRSNGEEGVSANFRKAAEQWMNKDLLEFADWVNEHQQNERVFDYGASRVSDQLSRRGDYETAVDWAQSRSDGGDEQLPGIYKRWLNNQPEAAVAWRLSEEFTGKPEDFPIPQEMPR